MIENFLNRIKSSPTKPENARIYHLSDSEIDRLRNKTIEDSERDKKEKEARLVREMADHEKAEEIRKLLQQEEASRKGPYVIGEKDREDANKFIENL